MRQVSSKLKQWLEGFNKHMETLVKNGFKPTPSNAREALAVLTFKLVTHYPQIAWIQDDMINAPGFAIPVRIYHPAVASRLPVLVYLHGGGHMAGSISVYDPICRKMAHATKHIVVSADYRLAPECPYPAGVTDACQTVKNVWSVLDGRNLKYQPRLSIAGDSGGGALCATVAHLSQYDAGVDIKHQVLIYPSLDYTMNWKSIEENATGYLLHKDKITWYFDNYFQNAENRKAASPYHMDFTSNLPQTFVITAGLCPLRDEAFAYLVKAKAAGLRTQHLHFDDLIHAFLNLEDLIKDECNATYEEIGKFLNH
ncbi:MAG: alpha/beta hydrolase [Desulfobacteraceae bacterium]|nr:alpha/beta hydrolase [Desulfobacteraceae bacterium]